MDLAEKAVIFIQDLQKKYEKVIKENKTLKTRVSVLEKENTALKRKRSDITEEQLPTSGSSSSSSSSSIKSNGSPIVSKKQRKLDEATSLVASK